MMKFLLKGFYGRSNLGDDLILARFLEWGEKSEIELIVCRGKTGSEVNELKEIYKNAKFISINDGFFSVIRYLFIVDVFLLGGGGLFPTGFGREMFSKVILIIISRLLGCSVILVGIGINPVLDRLAKVSWKIIYSLSEFISTRDHRSTLELLLAIGKEKGSKIHECADVVASLNFSRFKNNCDSRFINANSPMVVYSIADPWSLTEIQNNPERYAMFLETLVTSILLLRSKGIKIVIVPFFLPYDLNLAKEIYNALNADDDKGIFLEESPSIIRRVAWFSRSYFAVTMRFHGLVLATCFEQPACVIAYDFKLESLAESLHLKLFVVRVGIRESEFFGEEFNIDHVKFIEAISILASSCEAIKTDVIRAVDKIRNDSKRNFELIDEYFPRKF